MHLALSVSLRSLLTLAIKAKTESERQGLHRGRPKGHKLGKFSIKMLKLQRPVQGCVRSKRRDPIYRQRGSGCQDRRQKAIVNVAPASTCRFTRTDPPALGFLFKTGCSNDIKILIEVPCNKIKASDRTKKRDQIGENVSIATALKAFTRL